MDNENLRKSFRSYRGKQKYLAIEEMKDLLEENKIFLDDWDFFRETVSDQIYDFFNELFDIDDIDSFVDGGQNG